jgi:hypothetical protein
VLHWKAAPQSAAIFEFAKACRSFAFRVVPRFLSPGCDTVETGASKVRSDKAILGYGENGRLEPQQTREAKRQDIGLGLWPWVWKGLVWWYGFNHRADQKNLAKAVKKLPKNYPPPVKK